jgi:hypothetical protein
MQPSLLPGGIRLWFWQHVFGLAESVQHPERGGLQQLLPIIAALSFAQIPFFLELLLWVTVCCIAIPVCTIASQQLGGKKTHHPSSLMNLPQCHLFFLLFLPKSEHG